MIHLYTHSRMHLYVFLRGREHEEIGETPYQKPQVKTLAPTRTGLTQNWLLCQN